MEMIEDRDKVCSTEWCLQELDAHALAEWKLSEKLGI
jgi:hypothetical protein